jgi:hypothetical protein
LEQHAGLPEGEARDVPNDTLAEFWVQAQHGDPHLDLDVITDDIIMCLEQLNQQMNKENRDDVNMEGIDERLLAYAMSNIVCICLETGLQLQRKNLGIAGDIFVAAWRIACAWDALLAGDIEDLPKHVKLEYMCRFLGNGV